VRRGVKFLGVDLFPSGRRLKFRNRHRAESRLTSVNVSSYRGLVATHENRRYRRYFEWILFDRFF
jgi:hypothetical protein